MNNTLWRIKWRLFSILRIIFHSSNQSLNKIAVNWTSAILLPIKNGVHRDNFAVVARVAILLPESVRIDRKNAMAQNWAQFQHLLPSLHHNRECSAFAWIHFSQFLFGSGPSNSIALWQFSNDDIGSCRGHFECDRIMAKAIRTNRLLRDNQQSRFDTDLSAQRRFAIRGKSSWHVVEIHRLAAFIHCAGGHYSRSVAQWSVVANNPDPFLVHLWRAAFH